VLVPAGSFDLGSDRHADAKPVHTVVVEPFYLAKFELTQAQWKALMGKNPSYYQGEKFPQADQLPVEQVSWNDCRDLLGALNQRIPAEDSVCRPRLNGNTPPAPARPHFDRCRQAIDRRLAAGEFAGRRGGARCGRRAPRARSRARSQGPAWPAGTAR
jgi:hypothetical protein